jgi:hypothetical protein
MRTDPTDTGGLFTGRRPGTRPVKYRDDPQRSGGTRQVADDWLANAVLALMALVGISFWGPVPLGCMWIGSQFSYWADSLMLGIVTSFFCMLAALFVGLVVMTRIDQLWIQVRRAAGHDQREGAIGRVFAISCGIGVVLFVFWFLVFAGPGPSLAPSEG